MMRTRLVAAMMIAPLTLAGCAGAYGVAPATEDAKLVQGPPIKDISTPFDDALACLKGKISPKLVFAVGAIDDQTGKESFADGGTGKFVTQGAGDIVQSALFRAGASVVNRRDPRITVTEISWKIKDPRRLTPATFYVTGSINSLDFIPGSGAEISVAGVGPRYRQNRILIGLDLALTEANSSRVVANVPLQKQIFASESGLGTGRFFGDVLLTGEIGGREREALNFALRQMLNLATFDLLTQVMNAKVFDECQAMIDGAFGQVENTGTAEKIADLRAEEAAATEALQPWLVTAESVDANAPLPPPSAPSPDAPASDPEPQGVEPTDASLPTNTRERIKARIVIAD